MTERPKLHAAATVVALLGLAGVLFGGATYLVYAIADGAVASHDERLDRLEDDPGWQLIPPGRADGRTDRTCIFNQDGTRLYRSFRSPDPFADQEFYEVELPALGWESQRNPPVPSHQRMFTKDFGDWEGNLIVGAPRDTTKINLEAWVEPYEPSRLPC